MCIKNSHDSYHTKGCFCFAPIFGASKTNMSARGFYSDYGAKFLSYLIFIERIFFGDICGR